MPPLLFAEGEASLKKVGVVRYWPDLNVAEHENIMRIRSALASLGCDLVELAVDGRRLDTGALTRPGDLALVLNLHFDAPKCYDTVSVAPLWNPIAFYEMWGLGRSLANQFSHDVYCTTGGASTERLLKQMRPDIDGPVPTLNHTVAGPVSPPPVRKEFRYFYIGINWEKATGKPSRHSQVLTILDDLAAIDIYGPDEIGDGVRPWDGFDGYRGPLPFDGTSVVEAARKAGACLVLSSEYHKQDGIMSNRLFEAMAAGCIVVSDDHSYVKSVLGDLAYYLPERATDTETADALIAILDELNDDPEVAHDRAERTQAVLLDGLLLEDQLQVVIDVAEAHAASLANSDLGIACVLVPPTAVSSDAVATWLRMHSEVAFAEVVVLASDPETWDLLSRWSTNGDLPYRLIVRRVAPEDLSLLRDSTPAIADALAQLTSDWVVFADCSETIFTNLTGLTQHLLRKSGHDVDVVHHSAVRVAARRSTEGATPPPTLVVPGENEAGGRPLSSFVLRRSTLSDWLRAYGELGTGLLGFLIGSDYAIGARGASLASDVGFVPVVRVGDATGRPSVLGERVNIRSVTDWWLLSDRATRGGMSEGDLLSGVRRRPQRELEAAIDGVQRSVGALDEVRAEVATSRHEIEVLVEGISHPSATSVIALVETMTDQERLYLLQMLLEPAPRPLLKRLVRKLLRAKGGDDEPAVTGSASNDDSFSVQHESV